MCRYCYEHGKAKIIYNGRVDRQVHGSNDGGKDDDEDRDDYQHITCINAVSIVHLP